jgi:hypothetical protein
VEYVGSLEDAAYDHLLAENIVFLELIAAAANNTIIECIARNTPIVVNRQAGPEWYLGPTYPLFYESFDAIRSLITMDRIVAAHEYLKQLDKSWITGTAFCEAIRRACVSHCASR